VSRTHHRQRSRVIVRALGALALFACARPAAAQVAGTVVASGAPLPRVVVSLWAESREVARDTTDADGRFAFDSDVAREATSLALRRLGYVARTLSVRPGDVALRPAMVQVAQPLPAAVVAATKGRSCSRKDDPKARALWDSVRATYATAPRGMSVYATLAEWTQQDVSAEEVGERVGMARGPGAWGSFPAMMRERWAWIARGSYAWRRELPKPGQELVYPEYLHWWYEPLHRELVEHFVEDGFVRAHAFAMASPPGARTLAFCPRDAKRPGLEGTVELDDANAIARIAWRWRTPKPDEDAGAELLLMPPGRSRARRLVPARSVYWRRLGGRRDRYFQDVMVTSSWSYVAGERAPTGNDRVRP
jgi:hypothetical protein